MPLFYALYYIHTQRTPMNINGYEIKPYADLKGADLRYVDLEGADLKGADLEGADLAGADLEGTILEKLDTP